MFGARLQEIKTDLTNRTFCKTFISTEHTASSVFVVVVFMLVLPLKERKSFIWLSEKHIIVLCYKCSTYKSIFF